MARRDNDLITIAIVGAGTYALYRFLMSGQANAQPSNGAAVIAPTGAITSATPAPGRSASEPRGIRNNNPFNIKYVAANNWQGQIGSDGTFAKFNTASDGLRAGFYLLKRYINDYNLKTIRQIVSRWAPAAGGNNVNAYVSTVVSVSGIPENAAISASDASALIRIARGMIAVENGGAWANYFPDTVLSAAYNAA